MTHREAATNKLRTSISMMREAADEIRLAYKDAKETDLLCAVIVKASELAFLSYERLRRLM